METLKLQFDLAALAQVQAQTIEPDPTPWEALTFSKDLLTRSKHKRMATMRPEAVTESKISGKWGFTKISEGQNWSRP